MNPKRIGKRLKRILAVVLMVCLLMPFVPAREAEAATQNYTLKGMRYPLRTNSVGRSMSIGGKVTSLGKKITRCTVGVYTSSGTTKMEKTKWYLLGKETVNLKSFDEYIPFGTLKAGTYYYRVKIKRGSKWTTIVNRRFKLSNTHYIFFTDSYNGYTYNQFEWEHFDRSGCAMTSTAMVISNLKKKKITPDNIFEANGNTGYYYTCPYIYWYDVADYYGIDCDIYETDDVLSFAKRYPQGVVCKYSYGTGGTHYVVARYSKTYGLYFNDPSGKEYIYDSEKHAASLRDHLTSLEDCYMDGGNGIEEIIVYKKW